MKKVLITYIGAQWGAQAPLPLCKLLSAQAAAAMRDAAADAALAAWLERGGLRRDHRQVIWAAKALRDGPLEAPGEGRRRNRSREGSVS